jgi:hypothetical protein
MTIHVKLYLAKFLHMLKKGSRMQTYLMSSDPGWFWRKRPCDGLCQLIGPCVNKHTDRGCYRGAAPFRVAKDGGGGSGRGNEELLQGRGGRGRRRRRRLQGLGLLNRDLVIATVVLVARFTSLDSKKGAVYTCDFRVQFCVIEYPRQFSANASPNDTFREKASDLTLRGNFQVLIHLYAG